VGKTAYITEDMDIYFGGFMAVIRTTKKLNSRLLFHLLGSARFDKYLEDTLNSSTINNLNSTILNNFPIPVPPLEVQEEIVRILDKFTILEAELEAELEARLLQYNHYRNQMLKLEPAYQLNHIQHTSNKQSHPVLKVDQFKLLTIGDVCRKTTNINWNNVKEQNFKYIDLTSVDRTTKSITNTTSISSDNAPSRAQQLVRTNDVIFGTTRPTLKRFCLIPQEFDGQICSTGYCVLRANTDLILPRYLYFQMSTQAFEDYVEQNQKGSAYPSITDGDLKNFVIQLPSLEIQEKIVSILDRFETMVHDISSGLPAEIAARHKQYEYYRDQLLSFKQKPTESIADS